MTQQQLFAHPRRLPRKTMYDLIRKFREDEFPILVAWLDRTGRR